MDQSGNSELADLADASGNTPEAQSGSASFQKQRKQDSRQRMFAAAFHSFSENGYALASVEDIASRAGVSRMTFYRHFRGKSDIASELYRRAVARHAPLLLRIRDADWRDHRVVHDWLRDMFETDHANRLLLRVFNQASAVDQDFTKQAQAHLGTLIIALGEKIPAFALRADHPDDRRRWLEAWLLIYEILDQSNHAALDSGVASDPLMLDILADQFLAFVVTE